MKTTPVKPVESDENPVTSSKIIQANKGSELPETVPALAALNPGKSADITEFLNDLHDNKPGTCLRLLSEKKVYLLDAQQYQNAANLAKTLEVYKTAFEEVKAERDLILQGTRNLVSILAPIISIFLKNKELSLTEAGGVISEIKSRGLFAKGIVSLLLSKMCPIKFVPQNDAGDYVDADGEVLTKKQADVQRVINVSIGGSVVLHLLDNHQQILQRAVAIQEGSGMDMNELLEVFKKHGCLTAEIAELLPEQKEESNPEK